MRIIKQYPVAFFLIAALLITYPLGIGAFLTIRALRQTTGVDLRWASEIFLKFGPSLAGVLTIALVAGHRGVLDLLRRCVTFRGPALLYVFALLIQPLLLLAVLLIRGQGQALSGIEFTDAMTIFGTQLLLNVFLGGGLSEEVGWRGFMLPKLCTRYSLLSASVLVALAWFAWHVPAYFLFDKGSSDPILPFAVIVVPLSIVLGWIYMRSRESLSLPILLHGSINAAYYSLEELLPTVTERTDFQPAFDWWLAALWCVMATILVVSARRAFARAPAGTVSLVS